MNTRMNDNRYKANGSTQNSGIAEMSVDMYVVTPSIKLEGTAARPIQRSRRHQVISSASPAPGRVILEMGAEVAATAATAAGVAAGAGAIFARSRCLPFLPPFLIPVAAVGLG